MAGVNSPLTDLLKKGTFYEWGGEQQAAFKQLKLFLTTPPVLRIADPHRPFELITDVSDLAVSALLLQDFGEGLQPIAYDSQKLNPTERNYPVHYKELLAIVHAFKVWRCYLTGTEVTVRTDHKSLQFIRAPERTLNPRQIRWLDYLESNFHYRVTYKGGVSNIADALTHPSVHTFIPNMAGLTGPLTGLLQKGTFYEWGERQQAAFEALKNLLMSPPVLRIADPERPFEVITDASDVAIGAVLMQDFGNGLQPIAYKSLKMQSAERNYPVHDKEMLAIVHAFKIWRCYLTGADVTVRTDHKSLQYLRAQPNLNPRQIHSLDYLESNFTYKITYKKGANNIADALSRPSAQLAAVLVAQSNPLLN
ncbi:hypothetical protein CLOM_g9897 [Closterium sp. NIES-68]|nr:hypothetical protein CLOM_g9897 [Closterium sp. NIES-68]